jgi:hypothetical protein
MRFEARVGADRRDLRFSDGLDKASGLTRSELEPRPPKEAFVDCIRDESGETKVGRQDETFPVQVSLSDGRRGEIGDSGPLKAAYELMVVMMNWLDCIL